MQWINTVIDIDGVGGGSDGCRGESSMTTTTATTMTTWAFQRWEGVEYDD